jgi:hypothetical protein
VVAAINECATTPIDHIDARARIVVLYGTVYVGCYDDMRVVPLENAWFSGDKIMCCASHVQLRTAPITTLATTAGMNSRKRRAQTNPLCEHCGKHTNPDKRTSFYLYDDMAQEDEQCFRQMYFCRTHGPLGWVKDSEYVYKSDVITGLQEKWETIAHNGKYIPCRELK